MRNLVRLTDPKTNKIWEIDRHKKIKTVVAQVESRWVINCIVPLATLRDLIGIDFLEPILVKGQGVLSLCAIFMEHAAPNWMPLSLGPASKNCALRIACIDTRDGSQAVWVGERHTDSFLAPVLSLLGFPSVKTGLKVKENKASLSFSSANRSVQCQLKKGATQSSSQLFVKDSNFDEYFCAGIRSFSHEQDKIKIIDLHKLKDNRFERQAIQGSLKTPCGTWEVESAFLTRDGFYQWNCEGEI